MCSGTVGGSLQAKLPCDDAGHRLVRVHALLSVQLPVSYSPGTNGSKRALSFAFM